MGKKKKTYVKSEMKIIEVKTEGVIAASGTVIDPGDPIWNALLTPSCTKGYGNGGNASKLEPDNCGDFIVNTNGGCTAWDGQSLYLSNDIINVCCKRYTTGQYAGQKYFIIKKIGHSGE